MRLTFRPMPMWTDLETQDRKPGPFFSSWTDTLILLEKEIDLLAGRTTEVIIEVNADERAMRLDGGLRADAKVGHPGVVISFQSQSGPLRFACDRYEANSKMVNGSWSRIPAWQMNVRSIALTIQALRSIDRYGVTKDNEQFRGFTAIGNGMPMSARTSMSRYEAFQVVLRLLTANVSHDEIVMAHSQKPELWKRLVREASRNAHPDTGGSTVLFQELQTALGAIGD